MYYHKSLNFKLRLQINVVTNIPPVNDSKVALISGTASQV